MKKVRVGIVGSGFGRYCLAPAFRLDPRSEIVAIGAASLERAQAAAQEQGIPNAFAGWEQIVSHGEIDAVAIATRPHLQPQIAMAALANKKAVFAEKPLALAVQEALALHQAASSAKLANIVDFIFPELETWQRAKQLVREGAIGKIRHITLDWRMESYDNQRGLRGWKTDSNLGGGALQHFASHSFYYLEWMQGPIVGLFAKLFHAPDMVQNGDTFVAIAAQFGGGVSASVTVSNAAPFGSGHCLEIYGSEGCLKLINTEQDAVAGFRLLAATRTAPSLREIAVEPPAEASAGIDSRVRPVSRLVGRFIDWIVMDRPTTPSFRDGLRVQQLIEAAQRSHLEGKWVDCPGLID